MWRYWKPKPKGARAGLHRSYFLVQLLKAAQRTLCGRMHPAQLKLAGCFFDHEQEQSGDWQPGMQNSSATPPRSPEARGRPSLGRAGKQPSSRLNHSSHFYPHHFRINNLESTSRKFWENKKSSNGKILILTKKVQE